MTNRIHRISFYAIYCCAHSFCRYSIDPVLQLSRPPCRLPFVGGSTAREQPPIRISPSHPVCWSLVTYNKQEDVIVSSHHGHSRPYSNFETCTLLTPNSWHWFTTSIHPMRPFKPRSSLMVMV